MGTAATYRHMSSGEEGDGIIPRSMRFIFDSLTEIQGAYDVSVKVHTTTTCALNKFPLVLGFGHRTISEDMVRAWVRQVSFIEIYQDDIRDLLGEADSYVPVNVRESPDRGTFLENVQ